MDCLFCNIIFGDISSYKVYEDDLVYAFLDIRPFSKGHTLIIPKAHCSDLIDIDILSLNRVVEVAKNLADSYITKLHADGFNLLNSSGVAAQQDVFHFHLHLIPRYENGSLHIKAEHAEKELDLDKIHAVIAA